ncbi:MAG: PAS domain S-box protein [Candidatus Cloacimonetes bacterium]|nr:PAS domain S-box protein [Candidatus Cloacimonadota bacterium]
MFISKKIVLFFFFSVIIFRVLFSLELTSNEINLINNKTEFIILVSDNNYPYEYINRNGQIEGINIEIIKSFLEFTGKPIHFTINPNDIEKADIISSFIDKDLEHSLETNTIYEINIKTLSRKYNNHLDNYDNIYIFKQNYLLDKIYQIGANKEIRFYDEAHSAILQLIKEDNSIIFFDSIFIDYFKSTINDSKHSHFKQRVLIDKSLKAFIEQTEEIITRDFILNSYMNLPFRLKLKQEDRILYNILNKAFLYHESNNMLYSVFYNFKRETQKDYFVNKHQDNIYKIFAINILFFIVILYLLYKLKIFKFNLSIIISKLKKEKIQLIDEIEKLNFYLENVETQNKNVLENVSNLAFVLDLKGNITFINEYCKEILGYDPLNLLGHNIDEIIPDEHKNKLLNITYNTFSGDKNDSYEIEMISKEGLKKNFIFSTNFTKSIKGETQVNCILQDITDRKSLENRLEAYTNHLEDLVKQRTKTLKESEERFKFVIEKAYDGIFMIQNFYFTLVNEAFSIMTGFSKDKFYDSRLRLHDIIKPEYRDNFINELNNYLNQNIGYFILNTQLLKYNGDICDVEIHFTTITSAAETIILGVIHDIAEKKIMENKKLQSERLNVISSFAITANDRINSPLNAIQGYVELLQVQIKTPKPVQIKAFENIFKSISIIKNILNRLKSLTNVTLEKYNLDDLQMLDINKQFDENDNNKE